MSIITVGVAIIMGMGIIGAVVIMVIIIMSATTMAMVCGVVMGLEAAAFMEVVTVATIVKH